MNLRTLRGVGGILAAAVVLCSCRGPGPILSTAGRNGPRAAFRKLIVAINRLDERALVASFGRGEQDKKLATSFFGLLHEACELQRKVLAAHGEEGWVQFCSNEGVAQIYGMVATLNAYRERLEDLPVIYEGDRAFMPTLQNDYWLKFRRESGAWRADAHSLIGFKAHVSRQEATSFYQQTAKQLHEAAQKVGKKGVAAKSLGTTLGREITRLVRSRLFRETAPSPPAPPRKTD